MQPCLVFRILTRGRFIEDPPDLFGHRTSHTPSYQDPLPRQIGVTSEAVFVKKASSAERTSSGSKLPTATARPQSTRDWDDRSAGHAEQNRIPLVVGQHLSAFTRKMFSPDPSASFPSESSSSASSNPRLIASRSARQFRYCPQALALVGIMLE